MKPTMTKLSAWSWMHPRNTTTTTTTNLDPNSSRWVWRPTNLKHTPSLSSWNSRCSNTIMTHVLSPPTSMSSGANHVPTNAFLTWSAPSSADGRPDWWLWRHTHNGVSMDPYHGWIWRSVGCVLKGSSFNEFEPHLRKSDFFPAIQRNPSTCAAHQHIKHIKHIKLIIPFSADLGLLQFPWGVKFTAECCTPGLVCLAGTVGSLGGDQPRGVTFRVVTLDLGEIQIWIKRC